MANKPCITAEIYPNKYGGRIVLNTVHAEYLIWRGGRITKHQTKDMHCIGNGLHQWKDINQLSSNLKEELTYNWWILRRLVAWIGKVPNTDLPPQELGEITEKMKEMILQPIFWDGSLIHQLKSI